MYYLGLNNLSKNETNTFTLTDFEITYMVKKDGHGKMVMVEKVPLDQNNVALNDTVFDKNG